MGGKNSREGSWRQSSSIRSTSSSRDQYEGSALSPWVQYEYPQASCPQESQSYAPQTAYSAYPPRPYYGCLDYCPPPQNYGTRPHEVRRTRTMPDRRYSRIDNNYNTLEEVTEVLVRVGLESSNLIVGIEWTCPQESQSCAPQTAYPAYPPQPYYGCLDYCPPPQNYGTRPHEVRRTRTMLDRRYSGIDDNYNTLEEVTEALRHAGLESSNLIVGIDFTKSNEWKGARSFNRRSLHHIGDVLNPYEQAISIIGKTLAAFDEDNLIPCFGFGDASTHDQDVFSFYEDERFCNGFEEVLSRYTEIVPHLRLAGPTSFAPIIEMASTIVEQSGGQYHVLLIIADGQVTRSVDSGHGQLSTQEQRTVEAIVEASKLPLSIILVGVGDGPWDMMKEFDAYVPARAFDNFQFVNFTEIMSKHVSLSQTETEFAVAALMEIPSQYKAMIELNLLSGRIGNTPERVPLPPPVYGAPSFSNSNPSRLTSFQQSTSSYYDQSSPVGTTPPAPSNLPPPVYGAPSFSNSNPSRLTSFQQSTSSYYDQSSPVGTTPPAPSSTFDNQVCPICLSNPKDMAFGCGHQTCCDCGQDLQVCPICRGSIRTRIKLY